MITPTRIVLEIPSRLQQVLSRDPGLHGDVLRSLADFTPWLVDNKLPFFPDFTDHGVEHVSSVLVAAASLIRDEAWPVLTPHDAAAIVISTLLHDIAMHVSEDGFVQLIEDAAFPRGSEPVWSELWQSFLSEASRFDDKRLRSIFGDTVPVRRPPHDPVELTKRDRLLIGEFLRRHHARLAHEIAIHGVPGPGRLSLRIERTELRDLFGLIARSHGMELREAVDRLPDDSRRRTANAHVPFVMATLRIADYLQIHAERAAGQVLQVRGLRSPISRAEWQTHHSIREIHCTHEDPEAIYVAAVPPSAEAFARVRRLLSGIQYELDASWAVLGESYGRFGALAQLGLTLRRVRSNLDNLGALEKEVPYYPIVAAFETATASLLKLLIRPLYGDAPEVGVRELLQNAIDAVRERMHLFPGVELPPVQMTLHRADGELWLTVSDAGVGMNLEIVTEYFLRAGASFRWSDAWAREHAPGGKSQVLRSGRFGVGALAAFLIGDRIDVVTRHWSAANGIAFSAAIDDEVVELRRTDCEVGTSIRVRVRPSACHRLGDGRTWDWYCLDEPPVHRALDALVLPQALHWPACGAELPADWRRIQADGYDDVQWSFTSYGSFTPKLVCNGIRVGRDPEVARQDLFEGRDVSLTVRRPSVSVFDSAAIFPLNLQRSGLTTPGYPFDEQLLASVARDFVAWAIVNLADTPGRDFAHLAYHRGVTGASSYSNHIWDWAWLTPEGWALADGWAVAAVAPERVVVLQTTMHSAAGRRAVDFSSDTVIPARVQSHSIRDANNWLRFVMTAQTEWMGPFAGLRAKGRRLLISRTWLTQIKGGTNIRRNILDGGQRIDAGLWVEIRDGAVPYRLRDLRTILEEEPSTFDGFAELFDCTVDPVRQPTHPLAVAWLDIVGGPVMPYSKAARLRLPGASGIADLIAKHEAQRAAERARERDPR